MWDLLNSWGEHREDSELDCNVSVDGVVCISLQGRLFMLLHFLQFWAKNYQKSDIDQQTHFVLLMLSSAGFSWVFNNSSGVSFQLRNSSGVEAVTLQSLHSVPYTGACFIHAGSEGGVEVRTLFNLQNSIVWTLMILSSFTSRPLQQILHGNWWALDFHADTKSYYLGMERKLIAWLVDIWERKPNQHFGLLLPHQ